MSSVYHLPVLAKESVDFLVTDPNGLYIDATLGGGGHTKLILERLGENGRVIGVDQDTDAIEEANKHVGTDPRFSALNGNFGYMETLLPSESKGNISGILLDLGVSSHQIDEASRGFSFRFDGPLDMRMGAFNTRTAADVVNTMDERDLARIFFQYGEEKFSRQIAKAVVARRPILTTFEMAEVVRSVIHPPHVNKSIARIFQALRIEVNQEMSVLEKALISSIDLLKSKGRLVVISYHSLEDRIVKHFMRAGNATGVEEKDFYGNMLSPMRPVSRNIVTASDEEIAQNPRARSAKLRTAERQ